MTHNNAIDPKDTITREMENAGMDEAKFLFGFGVTRSAVAKIYCAMERARNLELASVKPEKIMTPNTQDTVGLITRLTLGMSDQEAATWALDHSYSFARAVSESGVAAVDAIVFLRAVQVPDD